MHLHKISCGSDQTLHSKHYYAPCVYRVSAGSKADVIGISVVSVPVLISMYVSYNT